VTRSKQERLFDPESPTGVGPVYQGVCKQIRVLFPTGDTDAQARKDSLSGTIAQARSLAASIDRVSGHGGGPQANGVPLATMHGQLDALMARLNPEATDHNPIDDLVAEFRREEVEQRGRAQASHTEE